LGAPINLFCANQIKTHLQARANADIAVGYQRKTEGLGSAFRSIYGQFGILGLWRGVSTTVVRVMVVSSVQLPTFAKTRGLPL